MLIETLLGPLEEESLKKVEIPSESPDGKGLTTRYFLDGELVRQDFRFEVTKAPAIGSRGGLFTTKG